VLPFESAIGHGGAMAVWTLNLLGGFELLSPQGAPVRIAERKARALLAYLALARERRVSREALMTLLWEDRPPAHARQSLRQVLHRLRSAAADPAFLRADNEAVAVDSARIDVDVWRFLDAAHAEGIGELRRVAALYRGPALGGIEFDEAELAAWLRAARLQLGQLGCAVLRRLALACHEMGDNAGAIAAGERLIAIDPHDEDGYRLLMQLHAAARDRAGLKSTFAALVAMCESHLDAVPSAETTELYRRLSGETPVPPVAVSGTAGVPAAERAAAAALPMFAVLRFQCARDDPDQACLADAISEELMLTLGGMRWLRVLARGASFAVDAQSGDAAARGRELGADYLVGGSLRRSDNRVKVGAWLIDARRGEVVWTHRYHGRMEDLFEFPAELAYRMAAKIEPTVHGAELRLPLRRPPRDLTAYDLVQRGYWNFYQGRFDEAATCFAGAAQRDSRLAHAYAMQALVTYFRGQVERGDQWPAQLEEARALALKAIGLDPEDAKAHLVLGQVGSWLGRYDEAGEALARAVALNPSLGLASSALSYLALMTGDFEGAIRKLDAAIRFRPNDSSLGLCLPAQALAHYQLDDCPSALKVARKALAYRPWFWLGQQALAASLGRLGRVGEATEVLGHIRQATGETDAYRFAARVPYANARWAHRVCEGLANAGWR
jgi:DNA-binding SARP family transcriptional activator/TolB-like protein/Flp pilus assembly protein TadD